VLQLADDLDEERRNHQAARYSLEQKTAEAEAARRSLQEESERLHEKTQEAEQRSRELAELETRSRAIHQENLELSARIARLVDEQQPEGPVAPEEGGGESTESPAVGEGGEDLQKELEKLKKMVEFKTGQLEAVTERVSSRRRLKEGFHSFLSHFWCFCFAVKLAALLAVPEESSQAAGAVSEWVLLKL